MKDPYLVHPSEDALERFLFKQSEDEELEIVETHFLACESCVTRLETLELNIAASKIALRSQLVEEAEILAQAARHRRNWLGWLKLPQVSFAGIALAACGLAMTVISVPRDVNLVAERGSETKVVVNEWVPLQLHLQARELPAGPVTVEAVDTTGKQMWQQAAAVKNEEIQLRAPRFAKPGSYLVRVYEPAAGDPLGSLVREYSITAKAVF